MKKKTTKAEEHTKIVFFKKKKKTNRQPKKLKNRQQLVGKRLTKLRRWQSNCAANNCFKHSRSKLIQVAKLFSFEIPKNVTKKKKIYEIEN